MALENFDYINRVDQNTQQLDHTNLPNLPKVLLPVVLVTTFLISFSLGRLAIGKLTQFANLPNTQTKQISSNQSATGDRSETNTLLSTATGNDSPVVARVAGATSDQNIIAQQATFTTIKSDQANTCPTRTIFSIGEKENLVGAHPGDELNWVGALDVLPDYPDPFIVNTHSVESFPWRSSLPVAKPINISFDLPSNNLNLELILGWGVGSQGSKSINVKIDQQSLGSTPIYQAELVQDNYQQTKLVEDRFSLPPLNQGTHLLRLQPLIATGDPVLFDYVFLVETCLGK